MTTEHNDKVKIEIDQLPVPLRDYVKSLRSELKSLRDGHKEATAEAAALKEKLAALEAEIEAKPTIRDMDKKSYRKVKSEMLRDLSKKKYGLPTPELPKVENVNALDKSAYRATKTAFLNGLRKGERR